MLVAALTTGMLTVPFAPEHKLAPVQTHKSGLLSIQTFSVGNFIPLTEGKYPVVNILVSDTLSQPSDAILKLVVLNMHKNDLILNVTPEYTFFRFEIQNIKTKETFYCNQTAAEKKEYITYITDDDMILKSKQAILLSCDATLGVIGRFAIGRYVISGSVTVNAVKLNFAPKEVEVNKSF